MSENVTDEQRSTARPGEEVPGPAAINWKARFSWFAIIAGLIALDQGTKALVMDKISRGVNIPVIDDWLFFTHVRNPGAAFGMFSDLPDGWRELFLGSLGAVALVLIVFYSLRLPLSEWVSQLGLHMIFAGAVGNLIDRFVHGSVTDFILFRHGSWSFPAFNIADSCIVTGVFILLIDTMFHDSNTRKKPAVDPGADAVRAGVEMDLVGAQPPQHETPGAEQPSADKPDTESEKTRDAD